ncbi:MAG TPA: hypothetical protein VHO91_10845 [Rhodopila sp.]|nr:hypothetical protein [Rhodopila sp.]
MKSIIFAAVLAAVPALAVAADPPPASVPITLSGREYEAILTDLANRDDIMRFLNSKQQAAQQAAVQAAEHARAEAAKPLHPPAAPTPMTK